MATRKQVIELFDRHAPFIVKEDVAAKIRRELETAPSSDAVVAFVVRHSFVWGLSSKKREELTALCKGKNPLEKEKKPGARA